MPTLGTLAAGIRSVSATRRSDVYITELGDDDLPLTGADGAAQWRRFQYFPESINDTKQVNYQTKEVPGASIPLYQYTNSGERQITFTAVFTTDVDHLSALEGTDFDGPTAEEFRDQSLTIGRTARLKTIDTAVQIMQTRLAAAGVQDRNPFIPGALVWLRRFVLPRYGESTEVGVPLTKPPRKLLLHITGSEIERFGGGGGFSVGGGGILCIMTQCDIEIQAFFPSGNIRSANVSLAFTEVAQRGGFVRFPSAADLDANAAQWYSLVARARANSAGSG
jgi:hypothetical protein